MDEKEELSSRIFQNCKMSWHRYLPYFDGVFTALRETIGAKNTQIATDAERLYFSAEFVIKTYAQNPSELKRGILHIYLHCLYFHVFTENKNNKERELWNLAADMTVELVLDHLLLEILGAEELKRDSEIRKKYHQIFKKEELFAENIYEYLVQGAFTEKREELKKEFSFDDHELWYQNRNFSEGKKLQEKWQKLLAYTTENKQGGQKSVGTQRGDFQEVFSGIKQSRYDYRKFLKQFSFPREEIELDTESFDYIFYHYGMEHYGNLPLIEPLEYKEVNRLNELVIAIDTSGSCSRETVQRFLEETYAILSRKENFFRKMQVYLIQCDCCIQSVQVIHSEEDWKQYSREITIQGRGGTDFRPVFRLIEEKRKKKEIKDLRALIYFTDGDGVYPGSRPDYQTAFVFLKRTEHLKQLPLWAEKLIIE